MLDHLWSYLEVSAGPQKLNHRDSNGAHTLQSKVELQKLWNRSFLPCPPLWSPFFLCGYCASEVSFSSVVTGHLWSPFCRELWCWCTALSTKVLVLVIYTIKMISTSFLDCQETCRMRFSRIFINPSQESTHPSLSGYTKSLFKGTCQICCLKYDLTVNCSHLFDHCALFGWIMALIDYLIKASNGDTLLSKEFFSCD